MTANSHLVEEEKIGASRLDDKGGFAIVPGILTRQDFTELQNEAIAIRSTGTRCSAATPDVVEERGGSPARAFRFALGRDCQWRLLSSATVLRSLAQVVGRAVMLAGSGSLIYYEEPGDFLELHRDIIGCDLAMITSLGEIAPASGGGELLVYPEFRGQPLAAVRAAGRSAATSVLLRPGETVVMLGGILPHEVTPLVRGQERIVSVMCYRI